MFESLTPFAGGFSFNEDLLPICLWCSQASELSLAASGHNRNMVMQSLEALRSSHEASNGCPYWSNCASLSQNERSKPLPKNEVLNSMSYVAFQVPLSY